MLYVNKSWTILSQKKNNFSLEDELLIICFLLQECIEHFLLLLQTRAKKRIPESDGQEFGLRRFVVRSAKFDCVWYQHKLFKHIVGYIFFRNSWWSLLFILLPFKLRNVPIFVCVGKRCFLEALNNCTREARRNIAHFFRLIIFAAGERQREENYFLRCFIWTKYVSTR